MAPLRNIVGLCLVLGMNAMRASHNSRTQELGQLQEVSFDPSIEDTSINATAVSNSEAETQDGSEDMTDKSLEDIADKADLGDNDMNACLIELKDYIFNFEPLRM